MQSFLKSCAQEFALFFVSSSVGTRWFSLTLVFSSHLTSTEFHSLTVFFPRNFCLRLFFLVCAAAHFVSPKAQLFSL